MKKILITGASGMVGFAVCREAVARKFQVVGLGRENRHKIRGVDFVHIDLTNTEAVAAAIAAHSPDFVIHLAANTNHTSCGQNPEITRRLHIDASTQLAILSRLQGFRLLHVSTEAVYGNLGPGRRKESDVCVPSGVYATTKKEAEESILGANPKALILRVTPVGFTPNGTGRSLAEWLLLQLKQGVRIPGFEDVFFTPISSYSLAKLIFNPALSDIAGVFNWGILEILTKYDFAIRLALAFGYKIDQIYPVRRHLDGKSHHGEMDSNSLSSALGARIPGAEELFGELALNCNPK